MRSSARRLALGRLPLQQALVDRAQLLDGHVAVVDEAPALARCGVAEVVDDGGDDRVRQTDGFQQRGGFGREEAAVVGRQADGAVAPVDQPAERHQVVVVVAGDVGEGVSLVHAAGDVVAHPLTQPVVVVAGVVDGEQPPVLGVEQEEQPVEEDQRRLARLRQIFLFRPRQRLHEPWEDSLEDHAGKILRDLLLVAPSLGQGRLQESSALARAEGVAAEQQVEGAQGVCVVGLEVAGLEDRRQVGFEIAAGAGPGAVVVEAPEAAVREDAPAQAAVRNRLRRREVAQDLAVGRAALHGVALIAVVERQAEALALLDQQRVPVALVGMAAPAGARLVLGAGEQQEIGDVFVAGRALLRQVVAPAQQLQDWADQLLLGDRFVGIRVTAEFVKALGNGAREDGEALRLIQRLPPFGGRSDAIAEEVLGEELPWHDGHPAERRGAAIELAASTLPDGGATHSARRKGKPRGGQGPTPRCRGRRSVSRRRSRWRPRAGADAGGRRSE